MAQNDIGIDLGTTTIIIAQEGKGVVLNQPSVVAMDTRKNTVLEAGDKALAMVGRTPNYISAIFPLKDGVISDHTMTRELICRFVKQVYSSHMVKPRVAVCVPAAITGIESDAVVEAVVAAGARQVYLIDEPIAAALGSGIDITVPDGRMIIDIGGGTSEIACISLGGIVCSESINTAGDVFTNDIQSYVRQQHNIRIGERTAEAIKCSIGAALTELDEEPEDYVVTGPNMLTALPQTVSLSYGEIAYALEKSLVKLDAALMKVLESMPPELYADIVKNGIYLAGGGALIKGLDKRLNAKTGIPFHVAEDPLRAIARGTGIALKNINRFSFLMK